MIGWSVAALLYLVGAIEVYKVRVSPKWSDDNEYPKYAMPVGVIFWPVLVPAVLIFRL